MTSVKTCRFYYPFSHGSRCILVIFSMLLVSFSAFYSTYFSIYFNLVSLFHLLRSNCRIHYTYISRKFYNKIVIEFNNATLHLIFT